MQRAVVERAEGGRAARELKRSDRRWLLVVVGTFAVSMSMFVGAHQLYLATGPHPEVTVFIRRVKYLARRFVPQRHRFRKGD